MTQTLILAGLAFLLLSTVAVGTIRTIRSDGHRHRRPPRTRRDWDADGLPSVPFARRYLS